MWWLLLVDVATAKLTGRETELAYGFMVRRLLPQAVWVPSTPLCPFITLSLLTDCAFDLQSPVSTFSLLFTHTPG